MVGEVNDFQLEKRLIHKDGHIIWGLLSVSLVRDEDGDPLYFVSQVQDISERKRAEEFMNNSEKLTVAGQLAAGIAHEIRNPLTAIKGFFQIMEHEFTDKKMYFEVINTEMERIETILNELLVLSKPQKTNYKQKNITTILHHVTTLLKTQTNLHNIEITERIDSNLPPIYCDENQLKQVFINFLKNSIEAMDSGGRIHIEVSKMETSMLLVRFKDEGPGIPDHVLKRIGEPFFTTKENGTGLGIMICKQIIENHRGNMHIESGPLGTIVEVELPIF